MTVKKTEKTILERLAALETKTNLILGLLIGVGAVNVKSLIGIDKLPLVFIPIYKLFVSLIFNSLF